MADFSTVPTVELLTRAADAAGKAADLLERWAVADNIRADRWRREVEAMLIASGPDHWRAVQALLRAAIEAHGPDHAGRCVSAGGRPLGGQGLLAAIDRSGVCMWVQSLRPLAEQVLQHLGDTA